MTESDLETAFRDRVADTDTAGRFPSAEVIRFMNTGQNQLALDIRWPEATLTGVTANGTQEIALPESALAVNRVYVGGQELVPSSIPILEGIPLEMYDQTGKSQQPEWITLEQAPFASPTSYPVANTAMFFPVPQVPGAPQRPTYYTRGANLGIIPVPNGIFTITISVIAKPVTLVNPGDICVFPEICKEAIIFYMMMMAKESDRHLDEAEYFDRAYARQVVKVRTWRDKFNPGRKKRPVITTYRGFYRGAARGPSFPYWWRR